MSEPSPPPAQRRDHREGQPTLQPTGVRGSIKQIAKASGCTNAALYYYFDGGKEHILHEVIRHTAQERINLLSAAANADSFSA